MADQKITDVQFKKVCLAYIASGGALKKPIADNVDKLINKFVYQDEQTSGIGSVLPSNLLRDALRQTASNDREEIFKPDFKELEQLKLLDNALAAYHKISELALENKKNKFRISGAGENNILTEKELYNLNVSAQDFKSSELYKQFNKNLCMNEGVNLGKDIIFPIIREAYGVAKDDTKNKIKLAGLKEKITSDFERPKSKFLGGVVKQLGLGKLFGSSK